MLLFQNISWGFDRWSLQNGLGRCQNGWFVAKRKDHRRNDDRNINTSILERCLLHAVNWSWRAWEMHQLGYNNVILSKFSLHAEVWEKLMRQQAILNKLTFCRYVPILCNKHVAYGKVRCVLHFWKTQIV